jgi:putative hemolysin
MYKRRVCDVERSILMVSAPALMTFVLGACGQRQQEEIIPPGDTNGLANPASVCFQGLGYQEETRESETASIGYAYSQMGPNVKRGKSYRDVVARCVQQGYALEMDMQANIATCTFPDGSSCMGIDYFEGRCGSE